MNKLLITLLTLVSVSAFATGGADMEYVAVECSSVSSGPDHGLDLQVIEGGFAGLTRIVTAESWIGGVRTNNYIVRSRQLPPNQANNFKIYESKKVALQIDITKKDADGKFESKFVVKGDVRSHSVLMKCDILK
jgi:hypothetical protein